ncbi:protein kinase superfamily protein [Actinidia rufa]|uniref:Protein kinase superfamily protein n=1 Tax=Actinidia rufa TaxID=165716 RepID=A0A7J0ELK1_9ERIC|nr:protein kinase superfamily protein [Actinidia rufa]
MKEGNDGFVRADQIDLKSLDEQLQRHLISRAWTMEKKKQEQQQQQQQQQQEDDQNQQVTTRQEWEIDPSKLVIRSIIGRGTFGTVHRGVYDGLDVAGIGLVFGDSCKSSVTSCVRHGIELSLQFQWHLFVSRSSLFELSCAPGDFVVKLLDWGEEGHRTEAEIASLRAAFTQEVTVWNKLDHPNVTKFIGATMGTSELNIQTDNGHFDISRNVCCVVVEYLPGGALKSFLIKNIRKKLAFKVVMQLALDLARGLSYLHSKKIVHRDVKTENMLLDKTRTVKIADFGVARVEASNPNDMTGETGTLGYMAPERRGFICKDREGVCATQLIGK